MADDAETRDTEGVLNSLITTLRRRLAQPITGIGGADATALTALAIALAGREIARAIRESVQR